MSNLIGLVIPLVAAVFALPVLNRYLGTERVGFLTLAWALIGYFSLFDLGIGRALTKLVAERLAVSNFEDMARLVWAALALMLALGAIAGGAMALSADWLVRTALRIPPGLQDEAIDGVRLLALTVPLVVTSAGLRGILEAQGRFSVSNAVRAPLGVWLIACPLLLIPFGSRSLAWISALLLVGRLVAWAAYVVSCFRNLPELRATVAFDRRELGPLLRFGGWMTVSNIISPLMVYMDRFLLGNRLSLQAVAWYATPFEVVTKVLVVPSAVATVLFPVFSTLSVRSADEVLRIYSAASRNIALLLFVPTFSGALFSGELLRLWLGDEFATNSDHVVQLIAMGCLLNSIAMVPFSLLQGLGRPDITAKLHLFELPVYAVLVFWLTDRFGITGTALAWAARMGLDLLLLRLAVGRTLGSPLYAIKTLAAGTLLIGTFCLSFIPLGLAFRLFLLMVATGVTGTLLWRRLANNSSFRRYA